MSIWPDNEFGLTNDEQVVKAADDFFNAAINDGWTCQPLYLSESIDTAAKLTKDGYVMYIFRRGLKAGGDFKWTVTINIWCPEKLHIETPDIYDWERIKDGLNRCDWCTQIVNETFRAGFANRVCKSCLPAARQKLEFPGWYN